MNTDIELFVSEDEVLYVDAFALQPFLNEQYPNEELFSRKMQSGRFVTRFLKSNPTTRIMTALGEKLFVSVDAVLMSKPINNNPSTKIVQRLNELKLELSRSKQSSSSVMEIAAEYSVNAFNAGFNGHPNGFSTGAVLLDPLSAAFAAGASAYSSLVSASSSSSSSSSSAAANASSDTSKRPRSTTTDGESSTILTVFRPQQCQGTWNGSNDLIPAIDNAIKYLVHAPNQTYIPVYSENGIILYYVGKAITPEFPWSLYSPICSDAMGTMTSTYTYQGRTNCAECRALDKDKSLKTEREDAGNITSIHSLI